ncbi:unnamed protein product [Caenorhabditis brenneri]
MIHATETRTLERYGLSMATQCNSKSSISIPGSLDFKVICHQPRLAIFSEVCCSKPLITYTFHTFSSSLKWVKMKGSDAASPKRHHQKRLP